MLNINRLGCTGSRLVFRLLGFWAAVLIPGLPLQICRKLVFPLFLAFVVALPASATDTTRVLTLSDFFHQIRTNHPVAKQAHLLPEQARREIRAARGHFDPEASSYYSQKQ